MNLLSVAQGGASVFFTLYIVVTASTGFGAVAGASAAMNESQTLAEVQLNLTAVERDVHENFSDTIAEPYIWQIDLAIDAASNAAVWGYRHPEQAELYANYLPVNWVAVGVLLHWPQLKRLYRSLRT